MGNCLRLRAKQGNTLPGIDWRNEESDQSQNAIWANAHIALWQIGRDYVCGNEEKPEMLF